MWYNRYREGIRMKKTKTIMNPECKNCINKYFCKNKTLMLGWIEEDKCKNYIEERVAKEEVQELVVPIIKFPKEREEEITKAIIEAMQELKIDVKIDKNILNTPYNNK